LVISFWFLVEIASVVSLHRNDRKRKKGTGNFLNQKSSQSPFSKTVPGIEYIVKKGKEKRRKEM